MGKEDSRPVESGVTVRTVAFERLVQELAADHQLFLLDPKGTPIGEQAFGSRPCFLLTDHIPMPKKVVPSLERLGARKLTLGPTLLFASHWVVLIHHAHDARLGEVATRAASPRRAASARSPRLHAANGAPDCRYCAGARP
jgi:tRNA (pseudouridine54-N1)-methyltransferase